MNAKVKIIAIFLISFIIYFVSSAPATPYNYFTRLADAFLHGRYYILENPSWLSELIPLGINKFAIVYPPAPALLLIPFMAIFGPNFSQTLFANFIGAGIVICSSILAYETCKNWTKTLFIALLVGLGNIIWFMSSVGSVWLLGQTTAVLFLLLAILSLEKKLNPILTGIFFGMAFLSRVELIVTLPFFYFIFRKKDKAKLVIGLLPFILLYLFYNFLRFGNILQTGYSLIPGVLQEPWYRKGIIHFDYIPNNLRVLFTALPVFNSYPFPIPSWGGLAIWITSPIFIYAFWQKLTSKIVLFSWVSILSILLLISMHGETGYAQFGYRFAVDFYPFIFYLIIKYLKDHDLKWHHWLLLFLSILVNTWGVILINKLGIVAP